ncbi:MAG: hypothetical protein RJA16_961 [Planctomycetota bacterium]
MAAREVASFGILASLTGGDHLAPASVTVERRLDHEVDDRALAKRLGDPGRHARGPSSIEGRGDPRASAPEIAGAPPNRRIHIAAADGRSDVGPHRPRRRAFGSSAESVLAWRQGTEFGEEARSIEALDDRRCNSSRRSHGGPAVRGPSDEPAARFARRAAGADTIDLIDDAPFRPAWGNTSWQRIDPPGAPSPPTPCPGRDLPPILRSPPSPCRSRPIARRAATP